MNPIHQLYIRRCIQLAKNGLGTTYPNPMVGAVIVHNQKIIGEGWHHKAGQPHAEVNAIRSVKDHSILPEATIYVSLEPCSHHGKTPPCSDLIIEKGIKNVVIGTIDPFSKVAGRGIKKLKNAGCHVTVGVLEEACHELNKRFFTFHTKKRPYIILKWAETQDGYIAPMNSSERKPVWITDKNSRQLVHKWRTEEQAILIGSKTVIKDNPKLTARDWYGTNPLRIIIASPDKELSNSAVLDQTTETIIISNKKFQKKNQANLIYCTTQTDQLIQGICDFLYEKDIQSLIIEGGSYTLQQFINTDIWDEARVFKGNAFFREGVKAPKLSTSPVTITNIKNDFLHIHKND